VISQHEIAHDASKQAEYPSHSKYLGFHESEPNETIRFGNFCSMVAGINPRMVKNLDPDQVE